MLKRLCLVLVLGFAMTSIASADFGVLLRGGIIAGSNNYDQFLWNSYVPHDGEFFITPGDTQGNAYPNKDLNDSGFTNVGIEIFSETPINANSMWGLRVGYVKYGRDTISNDFYYDRNYINDDAPISYGPLIKHEIRSEAYAIPIIAYYKYDINNLLSVSAGTGISLLVNTWTENYHQTTDWRAKEGQYNPFDYDGNVSNVIPARKDTHVETDNRTMFLVNFTAEARLAQRFSLIFDLGYQANGKSVYRPTSPFTNGAQIKRDFSGLYFNIGAKIYAF
jgi:hypothetical protein